MRRRAPPGTGSLSTTDLPMFGVKKLLLPIEEVLFEYDPKTGEPEIPPDDYLARPTVIAGVRPCDARAAKLLTSEMLREPPDPLCRKAGREHDPAGCALRGAV